MIDISHAAYCPDRLLLLMCLFSGAYGNVIRTKAEDMIALCRQKGLKCLARSAPKHSSLSCVINPPLGKKGRQLSALRYTSCVLGWADEGYKVLALAVFYATARWNEERKTHG